MESEYFFIFSTKNYLIYPIISNDLHLCLIISNLDLFHFNFIINYLNLEMEIQFLGLLFYCLDLLVYFTYIVLYSILIYLIIIFTHYHSLVIIISFFIFFQVISELKNQN